MNALQSRNTSGVHAERCSAVPCEKEGATEAVAYNNASDTYHREGIGLFWLSMCFKGFSTAIRTSSSWQIGIHFGWNPRL
jgi:hypothetical protein